MTISLKKRKKNPLWQHHAQSSKAVEETGFFFGISQLTFSTFHLFGRLESREGDRVEETREGKLWWDSIPAQQQQDTHHSRGGELNHCSTSGDTYMLF